MDCSSEKCIDTKIGAQTFPCFGPCGKFFHAKCVGIPILTIEKVNKCEGVYWFCKTCRKISISSLAFKMSAYKADIQKLSNSFDSLFTSFQSTVANLQLYEDPINRSDASTSTDSLISNCNDSVSLPALTLDNNDDQLVINKPLPSSSNKKPKNKKRSRSASPFKEIPSKKKPTSINPPRSELLNAFPSSSASCSNNSPKIISIAPIVNIEPPFIVPNAPIVNIEPPIILSNAPIVNIEPPIIKNRLSALPKPKEIYLSRLQPETSTKDIIDHLKDFDIDVQKLKCQKINKESSPFASFRLTTEFCLYEKLLRSELWPEDVIVREFKPKSSQAKNSLKPSKN